MKHVFADTSFFLALFEQRSAGHDAALAATQHVDQALVLTSAILLELGAALSRQTDRQVFLNLEARIRGTPQHRVVHVDEPLQRRGMDLFRARPDKDWSLTDCISILIMQDQHLTDVLTVDRHFAQAGFRVLLPLPPE